MEFLKTFNQYENVYLLNEVDTQFEDNYLAIRTIEKRVYSDQEVKFLPELIKSHEQYEEWQLRKKSAFRIFDYLNKIHNKTILDLGCGNGWFARQLAEINQKQVLGMDINLHELKQAARLFDAPNCQFAYGDIFKASLPKSYFDLVVINSALQYFPSVELLINRLFELLTPSGEIHIIDSPIYHLDDVEAAKERSRQYYEKMKISASSYHHHSWDNFKEYKIEKLYNPEQLMVKIARKFLKNDSPFPWIKIKR